MQDSLYDLLVTKLDVFQEGCEAREVTHVPENVDQDGTARCAAIYIDFMQTQGEALGKDCPSHKEEWTAEPHRVLYRYPSNFDNKAMRGVSDWRECDGKGVVVIWETKWEWNDGVRYDVPSFSESQWFNLCEMMKIIKDKEGIITYDILIELLSHPDVNIRHGLRHFVPFWELKDINGSPLEYQAERMYVNRAMKDGPTFTMAHLFTKKA